MIGAGSLTGPAAEVTAPSPAAAQPPWRMLLRKPTFLAGAVILLFWVVCAAFGPLIAPHDPTAQQLLATNAAPSAAHWFGTDQLGRDMLSRVIVGSRSILLISVASAVLGTVLGTALGLAMGYLGGLVDLLAGRVVEAVLALPVVIVAFLFIVAVGPSTGTLILVIGFVFTPLIARTVRSSVLVEFTVRVGYAIFTVATLSFLGFGVQPPTPDWGGDIYANYGVLAAGYWWETLFPALAIASLVVAINLVADSAEQVLAS